MPRLSIVVLSAVLGVCLALPAAAQWKWRGKDGRIQYSDLPPPAGTADQDILQRPNVSQRRFAPPAPASAPASAAPVTAAKVAPSRAVSRTTLNRDMAMRAQRD